MDGGTFTISNGGVFGSLMGTPIINPPQSAILGMHGIFERPVAIKGQVNYFYLLFDSFVMCTIVYFFRLSFVQWCMLHWRMTTDSWTVVRQCCSCVRSKQLLKIHVSFLRDCKRSNYREYCTVTRFYHLSLSF